jgi:hypothetical protein
MFAVRQKVAITAAAFVTVGLSLALMPAQASAQNISGTISFAESLLPHGFNSKVCQDFRVIAEEPKAVQPSLPSNVPNLNPVMEVIGKTTSGKITGSVKGGTVSCAYSIEMLQVPSGQVTVKPAGKPLGYKAPATYQGGFNPTAKIVNGKRCRPSCSFSNVNFVFENIGIPR